MRSNVIPSLALLIEKADAVESAAFELVCPVVAHFARLAGMSVQMVEARGRYLNALAEERLEDAVAATHDEARWWNAILRQAHATCTALPDLEAMEAQHPLLETEAARVGAVEGADHV